MNIKAEQSRFSVAQNVLAVAQSALALAQGSLAAAEDQSRSEVLERPLPPVPSQLKLFVWPDFKGESTTGIAFAIARDELDARYAVRAGMSLEDREYDVDNGGTDWGAVVVLALDKPVGFARFGDC